MVVCRMKMSQKIWVKESASNVISGLVAPSGRLQLYVITRKPKFLNNFSTHRDPIFFEHHKGIMGAVSIGKFTSSLKRPIAAIGINVY
jgi:hypothetical protein